MGKSFFINLIKKRFIEIQKMEMKNEDKQVFVRHLYFIKFDAWTYSKDNLWASLMYSIFKHLSEQLDMEATLENKGGVDLTNAGLIIIELTRDLSKGEKGYLNNLSGEKENAKLFKDLRNIKQNGDRVSKSFSDIFTSQMEHDKEDLKKAEGELKT